MQDLQSSWGETLPIIVKINNPLAATATFRIREIDGLTDISKSASFTEEGEADCSLNPTEMQIPLGRYEYSIRVDYSTGQVDKFPNSDPADDPVDYEFPILTVTEALDMPEDI